MQLVRPWMSLRLLDASPVQPYSQEIRLERAAPIGLFLCARSLAAVIAAVQAEKSIAQCSFNSGLPDASPSTAARILFSEQDFWVSSPHRGKHRGKLRGSMVSPGTAIFGFSRQDYQASSSQ
jgi:hypothetical protein